jgi:hypothetical protein
MCTLMQDSAAIVEHELLPTTIDKELAAAQNYWPAHVCLLTFAGRWEDIGSGYSQITSNVRWREEGRVGGNV